MPIPVPVAVPVVVPIAPVAVPFPGLSTNPFVVPPPVAPPPAPASVPDRTRNEERDAEKDGERIVRETEALYNSYVPQCGGRIHPAPLITTTTLAQATPAVDMTCIHEEVRGNTSFSAPQLDAIGLARMANLKDMAVLIGDGTGVGKGRELSGVMLNHLKFNPDCQRFIFITAKPDLEKDLKRDLKDIGWPSNTRHLFTIADLNVDQRVPYRRGVMFVTYGLLRSGSKEPNPKSNKAKAPRRSRLDQIVEWAGDFDGVIAFDEVHQAKDSDTATSKAVVELQARLPSAKVVYASATAMSAVEHIMSLTRLGLWDTPSTVGSTSYINLEAFKNKWHKQTRSGLEVVSTELAAQGLYIARRLSFEGTEFSTAIAAFTDQQKDTHDKLSQWWCTMSQLTNVLQDRPDRAYLWGAHLRFFKALLVAFRVKYCARLVDQAVVAGGSVVVSLIGTGEAVMNAKIEQEGPEAVEDGFVALQEVMRSLMKRARETLKGPSTAQLDELEAAISSFDLPPSPLDMLIDDLTKLGHGQVIELTGRKKGFYTDDAGKWHPKQKPLNNLSGCQLFQSGKAKIAIISSAASTGISLHNIISGPDRPRTQFMLELPWDAQQAMQQLGRTHRSDQHNAPKYVLVTSDLKAEKRFAATVSKRAADLGAATTGDRRGTNGDEAFGSDILIGPDAIEGLDKMLLSLNSSSNWPDWAVPIGEWPHKAASIRQCMKLMGIDSKKLPKQLLGRLLGMPSQQSNDCMHLFESACHEAHLQSAKRSADVGVEDVQIGEKTKVVDKTPGGGMTIATDIGITFDDAVAKAEAWRQDTPQQINEMTGQLKPNRYNFCTRNDPQRGRQFTVLAMLEGPRVRMIRPNGRSTHVMKSDFQRMYPAIKNVEDAKRLWDAEFELSLSMCSHGPKCKDPDCDVGKRFVTSTVVPMPGALNTLCSYNGTRQILRLSNGTNDEKCVVVRLSGARVSIEEKLMAEKSRQEMVAARVAEIKDKMAASMAARAPSSSSATSIAGSSSNKRILYSLSDDSDDYSDDDRHDSYTILRNKLAATDDSDDSDVEEQKGPNAVALAPKKRQRLAVLSSSNDSDSES